MSQGWQHNPRRTALSETAHMVRASHPQGWHSYKGEVMKLYIDITTKTWGDFKDLIFFEVPPEFLDALSNLSDQELLTFASEIREKGVPI